jgi:hypothetical protein
MREREAKAAAGMRDAPVQEPGSSREVDLA